MISIFLMFFWGMSDFVCMYYDFCFKGLEVIICNDMWLFGIYPKEIIVMDIDDAIVEIVSELKKQAIKNIDDEDLIIGLLDRWGLLNVKNE